VRDHPSGLLVPDSIVPVAAAQPPVRGFASRPLDTTTSDRDRKLATEGSAEWQREGWTYFDEIEEVKFAAGFRGALMKRLILFAGFVMEPDQPPVPVADVPAGLLPAGFADAAAEELARLGTLEQQGELLQSWGSIATVSGESFLIGQIDDMADTGERWRLFSESNIVRSPTGTGVAIRTRPGGDPEPVGDDDVKIRVWRPHARWPDLPDANMRSVLATAEELLIYARQFRAVGKGRNSAGILYIANEIGDHPTSDGKPTKFEVSLVESQVSAVTEDGAPASAIPHIVRGPAAFGTGNRQIPAKDAIFHLPLDRKIDEKAVERIDFLIKRLAHGLDVPVEVLTGIADINHWGAWQIEDSTYKAHIEPDALTFATAVTSELLRPGLLELFGPTALPVIRRMVVGVNPAALVVRPNRAQDAKDAYEADAISWEALRRYLNFPESDAPSAEEMLLKLTLNRSIGSATLTAPMLEATGLFPRVMDGIERAADALDVTNDEAPADDDQADAPADQPTPDPEQPDPTEPAAATAGPIQLALPVVDTDTDSAQPIGTPATRDMATEAQQAIDAHRLAGERWCGNCKGWRPSDHFAASTATASSLGSRLAASDRALADRLVLSASEAATGALRVLGQRLRAQAQGDPDRAAAIAGVPNEQVAAALLAAGFTLPDLAPLISDQFDQLHTRWDTWLPPVFDEASTTVRLAVDREAPDHQATADAADAQVRADQDQRTATGWASLAAALTAHVVATATGATLAEAGEADTLVAVPHGLVRRALAEVGGIANPGAQPHGLAGEIGPGSTVGGVATGPQTLRALRIVGYTVASWEWHHGAPTITFPPHAALSGTSFTSWDAPELTNGGAWPPFSTYFPGDHVGCSCSATPVFAPIQEG
jgi:hypothetical protein